MEAIEYLKHYQLEKDHWWFKGRRKIAFNLLKKNLPQRNNYSILDAGCGTGLNIKKLSEFGKVTGIDFSPHALRFCKKRGLRNVILGSVENMDFADSTFDIVTSFGVLYHQQVNDREAIDEFYRVTRGGGIVLITTPGMKWLRNKLFRTYHDYSMHTGKRHSKKEIKALLEQAGFQVKKISYFMTFLFLPVLFSRFIGNIINRVLFSGLHKQSEILMPPSILNSLLEMIMGAEASLIKKISLPFGVGLVALAVKPIKH